MFLAQPRPVLDYDPQLAPPVEGAGDSLGGSLRRPVKGNITPQEEQPYGKCKTKQNGHRPNLPADRFNVAARHVLHAHPAMYNIVDSIFVARVGDNALTAVSLAFPSRH